MDVLLSQKNVVMRLVNLDADPLLAIQSASAPASAPSSKTWKVLIYDEFCQNVLSTLLTVSDLRQLGVTLYMNINQKRQRVPDAPAVYFVLPTDENIDRIANDISSRLYDSFYLNFASSIPKDLMEKLAVKTLESDSTSLITKVFDQYCNFVSLEPKIFSLNMKGSYSRLHVLNDEIVLQTIDTIVDGLFAMCATMGQIPIIRARPGEAAAMVASRLDSKLRNHLKQRNNLFSNSSTSMSFQRPLLVILDRNLDLSVSLHHSWTYQALLHDLLGMEANRVHVHLKDDSDEKTTASKSFTYDLDIQTDEFWKNNCGLPFPKVAENVEIELKECQKATEKITRGASIEDPNADALKSLTQGLASAIESLPELQRKKRLAEMHVNIATAIMNMLTERGVDAFFSLEERMISGGYIPDKSAIMEMIDVSAKGTAEDKLSSGRTRLTEDEFREFKDRLEASGANVTCLDYLKKLHLISSMRIGSSEQKSAVSDTSLFGSLADKAIGKGIDWLAANVKNYLPLKSDLPVTAIVKELMNNNPPPNSGASAGASEVDNVHKYLYLDPRAADDRAKNPPRNRTPFKEAVVFMIGGGNYVEYNNLQDWSARQKAPATRSIIYGSTEMISPVKFTAQFSELAKQ